MAITTSWTESSPSRLGAASDPVLDKLASSNLFDSDWPTLRQHLNHAILGLVPIFLSRGPPRPLHPKTQPPARPPQPLTASSPTPSPPAHDGRSWPDEGDKPPAESLLLSPSQPIIPLDASPAGAPRSIDAEPSSSPLHLRIATLRDSPDQLPSTPGGLIIPPFPPLDLSRRRRGSMSSRGPIEIRSNGVGPGQGVPLAVSRAMVMFEGEWDEDIIIGGKRLPGWMEEEEGKKEVEKLSRLIEGMEYPPFTTQRIAELLLSPTTYHSTLGKFLRALEKALLVTSPWEPPSYTNLSGSTLPGVQIPFASPVSLASRADDPDSTMPPGATTPMFSPIPFLIRPASGLDVLRNVPMEKSENGHVNGDSSEEGLMSPLMLGGTSPNPSGTFRFAAAPNVRSPTPEPEEMTVNQLSGSESSNPGYQSYMGRVDELDTGPLPSAPVNGIGHNLEYEDPGVGAGEAGNMTPHGMSERPIPISSTTTDSSTPERQVAGIPRAGLRDRFMTGTRVEEDENGE